MKFQDISSYTKVLILFSKLKYILTNLVRLSHQFSHRKVHQSFLSITGCVFSYFYLRSQLNDINDSYKSVMLGLLLPSELSHLHYVLYISSYTICLPSSRRIIHMYTWTLGRLPSELQRPLFSTCAVAKIYAPVHRQWALPFLSLAHFSTLTASSSRHSG